MEQIRRQALRICTFFNDLKLFVIDTFQFFPSSGLKVHPLRKLNCFEVRLPPKLCTSETYFCKLRSAEIRATSKLCSGEFCCLFKLRGKECCIASELRNAKVSISHKIRGTKVPYVIEFCASKKRRAVKLGGLECSHEKFGRSEIRLTSKLRTTEVSEAKFSRSEIRRTSKLRTAEVCHRTAPH